MVGVLTAYLWFNTLTAEWIEYGLQVYRRTVEFRAGTPYQQRVLLPFLLVSWKPSIEAFTASLTILHLAAFPAWYVGLWLWLKRFGKNWLAVTVTVLSTGFIVLGLPAWGASNSWTMIEMVCMVWLLVLIDRDVTSIGIIVLATLNRPFTGGALALVYLLYHGRKGLPGALVYGVVLMGLLVMFQSNRWQMGDLIGAHVERNTGTFLWQGIINNFMWLMVWILAVIGWRRATRKLRVLSLAIVPYVLVCAVAATWYEVRLLLTVYPLAGALMVVGLEDDR